MAKTLRYRRAHLLTKLHEELLAAIPALRPETVPGETYPRAVFSLSGDGNAITMIVPDNVDEQSIASVLAAHDPTPPPPTPTSRERLVQALENATTLASMQQILLVYYRSRAD